MTDNSKLHKHHLVHIPDLTVDAGMFNRAFAQSCSMMNCKGNCCRYGVWADIDERKRILDNVDLIKRHMEPQQVKNSDNWFDDEVVPDSDFPSGKAVGTRVTETGCVFLDSGGRCVLQKAAMAEGMDKFALKPFYCVAYPITIEHGVLIFDDEEYTGNPQCCSPAAGGTQNVFDICSEELEFTIGSEGLQELRNASLEAKNLHS